MRRASIPLLVARHRLKLKSFTAILSKDHNSDASTCSSCSSSMASQTHLRNYSKSHGFFFKTRQFQTNPSQNLTTLAENSHQMAKTDMESEREFGMASLKLGLRLDQEGENPEKVLSFAERALRALDKDHGKPTLPLAVALQLLGSVSYSLKRFNESLGYLSRANMILAELEREGSSFEEIGPVLHAVQFAAANVKRAMGRREDAVENLRKCVEIQERIFGEDSAEVGKASLDLADAFVSVLGFKEALPFCLKALEIHENESGQSSVEVAQDRRLLGVIYTGLEEHEKALEQNRLSQKVLKDLELGSDLIGMEIEAANIQIALERYDEAIDLLRDVVQRTDKESEVRALVYVSMGKAFCGTDKVVDGKRCFEIARGILQKKEEVSPLEVADAYSEISMQYESMSEFETAILFLKRTLALLEKLPDEQHTEGSVSAKLGWLLLLTGKVKEAIPYLESAAKMLKESFGSKHFGIGYIYNNLGAAYLELEKPQSAVQMFGIAKDIMYSSLGPNHADLIEACQNVAKAYEAMRSYTLAIEFQQQVVDGWESHGPSAEDELRDAQQFLRQLKKKAVGLNSNEPLSKPSPLPQTSSSSS